VKNGAYKTGGHESTRLVNKEGCDLWKVPTHDVDGISGPFTLWELANALKNLEPGKSPGLDSIFPELMLGQLLNPGYVASSLPEYANSKFPGCGEEH